VVSLELVYYFAGGALIAGLLFGIVLGFALSGGRGGEPAGAPPPPRTETGVAMIREPDGTWRIEVGKQRYRHLQEIHDHRAALLVLEAMQALQAMLRESTPTLPTESRLQGPAPAEQLDRILQELLREHPELPPSGCPPGNPPGRHHGDPHRNAALPARGGCPGPGAPRSPPGGDSAMVAGKSPPVSRPVRAGHAGAHHR
jgi:hypothetical protein